MKKYECPNCKKPNYSLNKNVSESKTCWKCGHIIWEDCLIYKHSFIQSAINWFKENRMVRRVDKIVRPKYATFEEFLLDGGYYRVEGNPHIVLDKHMNQTKMQDLHHFFYDILEGRYFSKAQLSSEPTSTKGGGSYKPSNVNYEYKGTV